MKTAFVTGLLLFCTANLWAGIGEDKEDTIRRCGEPSGWRKFGNVPANTATAYYQKKAPYFEITFFTNKVGRFVSGKVTYSLIMKNELAEPLVKRILELNANGQTWTEQPSETVLYQVPTYKRKGVTAVWKSLQLTITLDEFALFCSADKKRLEDKKAKELMNNLK